MKYSIETLEKEKALIEKALNELVREESAEAKKAREKRLKELNETLYNIAKKQENESTKQMAK